MLEYCENVTHESLAQAELNNLTHDMTVLGMLVWLTKKPQLPKMYLSRFF